LPGLLVGSVATELGGAVVSFGDLGPLLGLLDLRVGQLFDGLPNLGQTAAESGQDGHHG